MKTEHTQTMTTYKLQSTPMIHAPGLIRYAQAVYSGGQKKLARQIINSWHGLPPGLVERILSKRVEVAIDGDACLITAPDIAEEVRARNVAS